MSEINIQQDKTYFIMKDNKVYTFFKAQTTANGLELLAYNRESITGYDIVDVRNISMILTEFSKEYNRIIKDFIIFLSKDLRGNPLLSKYVFAIWATDYETADLLFNEDVRLEGSYITYMQQLLARDVYNRDIVNYYYEVHCLQEIVHPKYSINWYHSFLIHRKPTQTE